MLELGRAHDHLQADGLRLVEAAGRSPGAPVPSCPEWDAAALVVHTSAVHHWAAGILRHRATDRPARDVPEAVTADWVAADAWYREGLALVAGALADTDPDTPVWNFVDGVPAPAAFWSRRMAQETSVHRVDAELAAWAAGAGPPPGPIDHELAADGIEECARMVDARLRHRARPGFTGSLGLAATDGPWEWTLALAPDHLGVRPGSAGALDVVRAPVSTLRLWLVHRPDPAVAPPVVDGPGTVAGRWADVAL
jgi:hypothetical protein